jgi:hypothetical protein
MKTQKITLTELRSLVKKIIKEENQLIKEDDTILPSHFEDPKLEKWLSMTYKRLDDNKKDLFKKGVELYLNQRNIRSKQAIMQFSKFADKYYELANEIENTIDDYYYYGD